MAHKIILKGEQLKEATIDLLKNRNEQFRLAQAHMQARFEWHNLRSVPQVNNEMKKINKSIDRLSETLYQKGYDGIYVLNNQQTGRLPDLLKAHLLEAVSDPMKEILPVGLRTIISLPNKRNKHLISEFEVDYDTKNGVHLLNVNYQVINSVNGLPIYSKNIHIKEPAGFPDALKVKKGMNNKLVKNKKRIKI